MVFITPKILRNPEDSADVLQSKLNERVEYIQENFNGRDPFGKQMDELLGENYDVEGTDIIDETLGEMDDSSGQTL